MSRGPPALGGPAWVMGEAHACVSHVYASRLGVLCVHSAQFHEHGPYVSILFACLRATGGARAVPAWSW